MVNCGGKHDKGNDIPMKIWNKTHHLTDTNLILNETFTEDAFFFDIETTGFSPAYTFLYLIGCAHRVGDNFIITQYFAETKEEEGAILSAFLQELCHYQTVISFNGPGFDIPYLKKKCEKYGLTHPFDEKDYIDIYKEVSGLKFLLKLPDYKQKTIERFLGLSRNDTFSGGELIEVYQNYLKTPDEQAMFFLKQHNYEDVLGMTGLIAIRSYRKLFDGAFTVNSTETNIYKDRNGIPQKELILTLQNQYPIPQRVSCQTDAFYLICDGVQSKLRIHLFEGTLKFFFDHPEDYYYLPAEDMAIHKSVASYVDKEFRKKATASNCYTKKDAIFVPQYETLITPFFKESNKDKLSYFELTLEFLDSDSLLFQYTRHVFRHFLTEKH